MQNINNNNTAISLNKSCEKNSIARTEESLAKAASVLKSLSNWNKENTRLAGI